MNTRPSSSSYGSQLGAHEWLIQRAALPPTTASITRPSSSSNRNVWYGLSGSLGGRRSASFIVMRSPRYSMMSVPLRMLRVANTPRPWIADRRTTCGRAGAVALTAAFAAGFAACLRGGADDLREEALRVELAVL